MPSQKLTKLTHQSKLSLKRSNSDSSQNTLNVKNNTDGQESSSSDQSSHKENDPCPSNVEDSLADFKSPKEEKPYKPILNKFKIDAEKVKKKIAKSKSKSRKSTSSDINQPSIESSFFKPKTTSNQTELKESVPCPLCLKPFKDDDACTSHMKTCASKNKVSFKQLLDAKTLQDRQAEERKAMGLLAAPVLPEKKKAFRSKNFSTGDDPQLQLVLAMSESLYEAQKIAELEQAALLAGIPSECIKEMNYEDRKSTLQTFGFTTNKPITESTLNKPRKKKLLGPTILQTRSKEDKDRVLTERIACILTGDDALTQVQIQERTGNFLEEKEPTVLRSKILKEIEKPSNKLWDRSRLTKKCNNFYVEGLKNHFLQSDQKLQSDSHDTKHINNDDEYNILSSSVEYEPVDFNIIDNLDKEKNNSVLSNMAEVESKISKTYEIDFTKNLISNWGETLNDSTESDVIVFVKDDKHIYAHKLVFHVQCSNILLDIEPNDTVSHRRIKKKICWPDKDKLSALAFLEFIYCGTIKKYVSIFDQANLISEVQTLARLYKVEDLFTYVRNKQNKLKHVNEKKSEKVISDVVNKSTEQSSLHKNINESMDLCNDIRHISNSIHIQPTQINHSDPTTILQKSTPDNVNKNLSVPNFNDRRITASPDLFESENEEDSTYSVKTQMNSATNLNNTNLNILVDLVNNEDEKEDAEISQLEENLDDHRINSQKTIVNLSRTPSPLEVLSEALTPKCMSPEICHTLKQEEINQEDMEIAEAVTPKRMSPVTLSIFEQDNSFINKITDAVTPKRNSPNRPSNKIVENNNSGNNLISEALTQKLNSPIRQNHFLKNIYLQQDNKTLKVANTKSDSSQKLDDCNSSNAKPQETEDDFDESIYTAVTPPRSVGMKVTLDKNNFKKLQTDLSLFIDKIKKENAKSLLDSDSELDTPDVRAKPRNPFAKRLRDDSYACLVNEGGKGSKKGISLLENQILEDENRLNKNDDISEQNKMTELAKPQSSHRNQKEVSETSLNCAPNISKEKIPKNCTSDNEIEDITLDEKEMSRYSKYKKKNRHDNSIARYRNELKRNSSKQNSSGTDESTQKQDSSRDLSNRSSISKKVLIKSIKVVKPKSVIEDITLVSDSDDDGIQTNSSTILSHCNISNKNNSLSDIEKEKSQTKMLTDTIISNIQNDSTFPLDLVDSRILPSKVVNSTALKEKSDNKVIDLSSEPEEENIYNDSTFPRNLAVESDNSLKYKKVGNKEASLEKSKQMDLLNKSEKINYDVDVEISKILELSPDFTIKSDSLITEKTSNQSKKDSIEKNSNQSKRQTSDSKQNSNVCDVVNLSPVSIISSSDHDEFDNDKQTDVFNEKRDKKENKKSENTSNKNVMEFDTIESAVFHDIEVDAFFKKSTPAKSEDKSDKKSQKTKSSYQNSSKKKLSFESSVSNAESCAKSSSSLSKPLTSPVLGETMSISPVLSQNRRKSRGTPFDNDLIKPSTSQRRSKTKSPKKPSIALNLKNVIEKLHEDNLPVSSTCVTPKHNRKSLEKISTDNEGITPPQDYSILGTPELQKQLKKYGVKPLNRQNAKLMLRHIYNETHEGVSAQKRASSTSGDEEPPPKKKNVTKGPKMTASKEKTKSRSTKTSKDCSMIAEEMDYDDPDVQNNVDNPVSIKDVFDRLLQTNKDLKNKVMTYEPLSLESLHSTLKKSGFKCKINSLMDFLDEQCITFQVQNGKGNRTKKKKSE